MGQQKNKEGTGESIIASAFDSISAYHATGIKNSDNDSSEPETSDHEDDWLHIKEKTQEQKNIQGSQNREHEVYITQTRLLEAEIENFINRIDDITLPVRNKSLLNRNNSEWICRAFELKTLCYQHLQDIKITNEKLSPKNDKIPSVDNFEENKEILDVSDNKSGEKNLYIKDLKNKISMIDEQITLLEKLQDNSKEIIKSNKTLQASMDKIFVTMNKLLVSKEGLKAKSSTSQDNSTLQENNSKLQEDNSKLQAEKDKLQADISKLQTNTSNLQINVEISREGNTIMEDEKEYLKKDTEELHSKKIEIKLSLNPNHPKTEHTFYL